MRIPRKQLQETWFRKGLLFLWLILPGVLPVSGQQLSVTGLVTSAEDNAPLPGVSVTVKGTQEGTVTDIDGRYQLELSGGEQVLVFSFIGFRSQEVPVGGRTVIDISLETDVNLLEEAVVIGYGTEKKINVIGSVATISNKEITSAPVSSISNALVGRLPGAIIQQRSGEPGNDAASILIRGSGTLGNTAPLIVIDGIPGRDLNSLNASDVESISVLKDASAAIYGARAANGVILVTTKRGREGTPATFNYSFYEGLLSPTMLPEMADAATYAQMIREMESYQGIDESGMTFSEEDVEKFRSGQYPWTHPNTNWWDATLKDHSHTRHHNFSVSGGSKAVSYYGSFGTQFDDGLYKNSAKSYNRYNLTANVDIRLNEYLNVGINLNGIQENRMGGSAPADLIFNLVNQSKPTTPAVFPNGLPGPDLAEGLQPVLLPTFASGFDDDKRYRSNNMLSATFKVPWVQGLSASSYYAYDVFFGQRKLFTKPLTIYSLDEAAYLAAGNTGSEDGSDFLIGTSKYVSEPQLTNYYDNYRTSTFNFKVDYDVSIAEDHQLSAFIAYEQSEENGQGITAFRRYFASDKLPYLFAGGDAEKDNSEYVNIDSRVNYFGRISYNYKDTYLLQFAFRRDGSLRFSKESGRWGNFPSVLAGWRISNEDFWKDNVRFVDYLKLKASWGQMGSDLVPPFQYLTSYITGLGGVYGDNGTYSSGLYQAGAPNPFITWEVANTYNAGFESTLFNSRLIFNVDFFYQRRNNILVKRNASVPSFTGITLPDENFGIVDNKGFEVELGYNKQGTDISYGINGNLAFARNSVVEFDEPERNVPWQVQTGHPMGTQLLYKSAGIFRDEAHVNSLPHVPGARPGDVIILDYDGDGEITNDDRILFDRTTNPEITYGVSFNIRYRNLELRGLVNGAGSAWVRMLGSQQGSAGNYYQYSAEGRWTPENPDASKPRAYEGATAYWRGSHVTDMEYQDQSYARLRNLQLTYTFPEKISNTVFLKNAQVFVSGQNLFLIYSSKDRIWDPEFSGSRDNYPLMKVFSVGANITF